MGSGEGGVVALGSMILFGFSPAMQRLNWHTIGGSSKASPLMGSGSHPRCVPRVAYFIPTSHPSQTTPFSHTTGCQIIRINVFPHFLLFLLLATCWLCWKLFAARAYACAVRCITKKTAKGGLRGRKLVAPFCSEFVKVVPQEQQEGDKGSKRNQVLPAEDVAVTQDEETGEAPPPPTKEKKKKNKLPKLSKREINQGITHIKPSCTAARARSLSVS